MAKKSRHPKMNKIIWALVYFAIVVLVCVTGVHSFRARYFGEFYVSGNSMYPTLNNDPSRHDFGLADTSEQAINTLKRFDILLTYYPWSDYENNGEPYKPGNKLKDADKPESERSIKCKIKRLIGLPGETVIINNDYSLTIFTLDGDILTYDRDLSDPNPTDNHRLPYNRNIASRKGKISERARTYVLEERRYLVMGDNWDDSEDCTNANNYPVYRENLYGKFVCVFATCDVINREVTNVESTFFPKPY